MRNKNKVAMNFVKQLLKPLCIIAALVAVLAYSCNNREWNDDPNFELKFSSDTIFFDTIFTSIGTCTYNIKIYNTSNKPVNIKQIILKNGEASPFRINVDGVSGTTFNDVEIYANDSLFLFAKATIDPNNTSTPFICEDDILFFVNNSKQNVKLLAWGQNAHFYNDSTIKGNITLTNDKPHVIYKKLIFDTLSEINIEEGTQLCFHNDAALIVKSGAKILAHGTLENPVVFRGDKYAANKPDIDIVPGQWIGIFFENSHSNVFTYTEIRNAKVGLYIDSCDNSQTAITLHNCLISNNVSYGLRSVNANIIAANTEFSNSGGYLLSVEGASTLDFRHCTFANYFRFGSRKSSSILLANTYYDTNFNVIAAPINNALFGNCIVYGSKTEEINIRKDDDNNFNVIFENCLIRTETSETHQTLYNNCVFNEEPKFVDVNESNFLLDSLSAAINIGSAEIILTSPLNIEYDRLGIRRELQIDAGCYSYNKTENGL